MGATRMLRAIALAGTCGLVAAGAVLGTASRAPARAESEAEAERVPVEATGAAPTARLEASPVETRAPGEPAHTRRAAHRGEPDRAGPERAGSERAGVEWAGLDRAGADPRPVAHAPALIDDGLVAWYDEYGLALPDDDRLVFCHGYGCELKTAVPVSAADKAMLARLLRQHGGSPAAERDAVNLADQWWERHAAPYLGGPPRTHGSTLAKAHQPGQTDCLDEATNTTTILVYLERLGLLRYHHVRRPEARGSIVYAHAAAVITDRTTGIDWAADAWTHDSGQPIDIMTLDAWRARAYGAGGDAAKAGAD